LYFRKEVSEGQGKRRGEQQQRPGESEIGNFRAAACEIAGLRRFREKILREFLPRAGRDCSMKGSAAGAEKIKLKGQDNRLEQFGK